VLAAGGIQRFTPKVGAELYDPATGTWTVTGNMNKPRNLHGAVLLQSGEVLVAGADSHPNETADLYDPTTGTWMLTGNLPIAVVRSTLTLLSDGRAILAVGGYSGGVFHGSTIYDPVTSTWGAIERLNGEHDLGATATLLLDGRVLLVGGFGDAGPTADVDLYQSQN
jgi:hypothetical protein